MLGEEKRLQALELVHTLDELATNLEMKLRIIDAIRECEDALQGEISENDWVQIELQLGEVIGYMEKQILGEESGVTLKDDRIVSKEDIKKRILEIWNGGRKAGDQIASGYRADSTNTLQNVKSGMRDCANADANYHLLSVPEQFESKCIQMSQTYSQDIEALASDYLNEICEHYAQTMNRIKGLLSTIDRKQIEISARDIYEKWDSRQELCKQELKGTIAGLDNGSRLLIEFGNEQMEPLGRIKKKNRRKRLFYRLLPLLCILFLAVGGKLISFIPKAGASDAPEASASSETAAEEKSNLEQWISKAADAAGDKGMDEVVSKTPDIIGRILSFVVKGVLPVIVLAVVAYFLWFQYTDKRYRSWMVEQLGDYIGPKVEEFWRTDSMENAAEAYFKEIHENTVDCYENLFRSIIGEIFGTKDGDAPAGIIRNARMKWNQIRTTR